MAKLTLKCRYCTGAGPEDGFLWMDNNGPIVRCPVCNPDSDTKRRAREYEAALAQRASALLPQDGKVK